MIDLGFGVLAIAAAIFLPAAEVWHEKDWPSGSTWAVSGFLIAIALLAIA